jgi:hypothetical protein
MGQTADRDAKSFAFAAELSLGLASNRHTLVLMRVIGNYMAQ